MSMPRCELCAFLPVADVANQEVPRETVGVPALAMPDDISREVIESVSLSLAELAVLAPTSRSFHDVYWEARVIEQAWLADLKFAAESNVGPRVIDFLCQWLFSERRDDSCGRGDRSCSSSSIDASGSAMHRQLPRGLHVHLGQHFVMSPRALVQAGVRPGESKVRMVR